MGDKCFDPKEWYCVLNVDKCQHSVDQLNILKTMKEDDASLQTEPIRVIDCGDPANHDVKICKSVHAFPAFCNTTREKCVYGVRASVEELETTCRALTEGAPAAAP